MISRSNFQTPNCVTVVFMLAMGVRGFAAEDPFEKIGLAIQKEDHRTSVKLLDEFIKQNPTDSRGYYVRGRENFRIAHVDASLSDFNKYIELHPQARTRMWERGITCFYAKKFAAGAKQFELYQTYHSQDVENGVWHILCKSKIEGFKKAAQRALDIQNDRRVPMMEIYDLFRGKIGPDDVMKAANQPASKAAKNAQLFYAHLYCGLFHDVNNDEQKAKVHLTQAVAHKIDHYMWDVARVHLVLLKKAEKQE